jgi:hypothetical protein
VTGYSVTEHVDPADFVGCDAGFIGCLLEDYGGQAALWPLLLVALLILGIVACALAYAENRRDRPGTDVRRDGRARVVAGPVHRDGVWVRVLEIQPGMRRVEVYGVDGWVPAHRDPSHFFTPTRQPAPGRPRTGPPRATPQG